MWCGCSKRSRHNSDSTIIDNFVCQEGKYDEECNSGLVDDEDEDFRMKQYFDLSTIKFIDEDDSEEAVDCASIGLCKVVITCFRNLATNPLALE